MLFIIDGHEMNDECRTKSHRAPTREMEREIEEVAGIEGRRTDADNIPDTTIANSGGFGEPAGNTRTENTNRCPLVATLQHL